MRDPGRIIGAFVLSIFWVTVASAQSRWIKIETNQAMANVYADSTWLGTAVGGVFAVPEGSRVISLVPPIADVWSIPALQRQISGLDGDTLRLDMWFPYYYSLESIPSSAKVYLSEGDERTLLGDTPLVFSAEATPSGTFVFDRDGFLSRTITPGLDLWNRHLVSMEPVDRDSSFPSEVSFNLGSQRRKWIDYVAIGTAVTAGILAVHFKTKANNRYARYEITGDPGLRPDIDRLDLYSGVALGAMQAGLGLFAFRLIF